jgi:NAD(P)-dependent dehydrogenase (short-subunit alcohol dehydrogenase family)
MKDPLKQFELRGQIAAITGAGGELCGMMSEGLASIGVKVALLDIDQNKADKKAEAIQQAGGEAFALRCDVTDEESLTDCYSKIVQKWGEPDILINGAGGNHPAGSTDKPFLGYEDMDNADVKTFFDLGTDGIRKVFDLNFLGTLLPTMVFSKGMMKEKKGKIVNIASVNAHTPLTKIPAYAAAKEAVANLTKWLAVHFAHVGIRVNAIAPGFVMTEQLKFLHIDQETGEFTDRAKQVLSHTPMGRYGEPEELLGGVIYLLSDAASFVTGSVLYIDGGFTSYSI